jgi:hypothetical protein
MRLVSLLFALLLACPTLARADDPAPAATPAPTPKDRVATTDGNVVLVPWGNAYRRAGGGGGVWRTIPLIKEPGVLWDTTQLQVGAREFFGVVNNSVGVFASLVPIAVFKLELSASYDSLIPGPFDGGLHVLSPAGRARLGAGAIGPNDATKVGWEDGLDRRDNYDARLYGHGLRAKIAPTLQAKVGPVAAQYNFVADWNFYAGGSYGKDDVFQDSFTFTLRKMQDLGVSHELIIAVDVPAPGELQAVLGARWYHIVGTGLDSTSLSLTALWKPPRKLLGDTVQPWLVAQAGTLLKDPMYQGAFSWVVALGGDFTLKQ